MGRIGRAAFGYFAAVFAVGCAMGVVREMLVGPHLGAAAATAVEAPMMLLASFLVARAVVRRGGLTRAAERLRMGLLAFALLMVAEIAGSVVLRGMALTDWLARFAEPDGMLSLGLFVGFAVMPLLVGPRVPTSPR